jgi:hypothetical protein
MDVLAQRYTTGQVLRASGATNAALQTWIRRGFIVGQRADTQAEGVAAPSPVDMPGESGHRRTFSFYGVVQIAVAKAIIDVSGKAERAFEAAIEFAHLGDEQRSPGVPFRDGRTWLLVAEYEERLVNATWGADPHMRAAWAGGGRRDAVIAVDVNAIFDRVCAALDIHPQAVIEANTAPADTDWQAGTPG